jgi:hypothetical protein
MKDSIKIKDKIAKMETKEVLVITDEKGRKYIWDGEVFYRGKVLKG